MTQRTTETANEVTSFTAEMCAKWINQLAEVRLQVRAQCENSKIKDCIEEESIKIDDGLATIAYNIAELLKQQHLNDHFFSIKGNN